MAATPQRTAPLVAIRHDLAANGCSGVYAQQRLQLTAFQDLLPGYSRSGVPAIYGTDARAPLTHDVLFNLVQDATATLRRLHALSSPVVYTPHARPSVRIGVVLPNGPEVSAAY